MKKLLILLFSVLLWGCGEVEVSIEIPPRIPYHILLSNSAGESIGMAVPIQDQIFVTADHLLNKYENLFWQGNRIHVMARDFENNLLFFKLSQWDRGSARWSDTPPVLGSEIFWIDGSALAEEKVHSVLALSEDQIRTDVIVISGTADIQNSGSPVFDKTGVVYGILVGGDMPQKLSYAVRSDILLSILAEHLE